VPKFSKFYGLSNASSLEKIGRRLFVSRFYTVYRAKSRKMFIFKAIKTKISSHSIKRQKLAFI
jgi:hypothetical protein